MVHIQRYMVSRVIQSAPFKQGLGVQAEPENKKGKIMFVLTFTQSDRAMVLRLMFKCTSHFMISQCMVSYEGSRAEPIRAMGKIMKDRECV